MSILHAAVIIALVIATIEDAVTLNFGDLIFDLTLLGNQLLPARACILTYLENIWRVKAGIRPVKGWISHYVLKEYEKEETKQHGNAMLHCGEMDETVLKALEEEKERSE
jgi:isoprenylcysteine carboxyl methyltransferase (ICMT) family protein YpbQ